MAAAVYTKASLNPILQFHISTQIIWTQPSQPPTHTLTTQPPTRLYMEADNKIH